MTERCDGCQRGRVVGIYECEPGKRMCLNCHIEAHAARSMPASLCPRFHRGQPVMVPFLDGTEDCEW